MVRLSLLALAWGIVAADEVEVQDGDEALFLLQVSARRSSLVDLDDAELSLYGLDFEDSEDSDGLDQPGSVGWPTWPIKPKPAFGPDGTWATPYCKEIQGCKPYCPNGCNGAALWKAWTFPNARFGVVGAAKGAAGQPADQRVFMGCHRGKDLAPVPVGERQFVAKYGVYSNWMNCLNSENSTKAPFWQNGDAWKAEPLRGTGRFSNLKMPTLNNVEEEYYMTPYGHEFCPVQCVNDCAYFKYGNFHQCGTTGSAWLGYDQRASPDVGSNRRCNVDHVTYGGAVSSYLWCGEPTTTTTPPPPAAEPSDVDGDDAEAIGDPHMRTNTNTHFDLE